MRKLTDQAARFAAILCFASAVWACGDSGAGNEVADVGDFSLVAVTPRDLRIGVSPGHSAEIRVSYRNAEGESVTGVPVAFSILGNAGGAALSTETVFSNEEGEASVTVQFGFSTVDFRVMVSAAGAEPLLFNVVVNPKGFGTVNVRPTYPLGDDLLIDVVIYDGRNCDTLSPEEESVPFDRGAPIGREEIARFDGVPLDRGYAVAAIGRDDSGTVIAFGCIDFETGTKETDGRFDLRLTLLPVDLDLIGSYRIDTSAALASDSSTLSQAFAPWVEFQRCTAGSAQYILDCVLDAVDDSGDPSTDCMVAKPSPVVVAIQQNRGGVGPDNCREPGLAPSALIDDVLAANLDAEVPQAGATLAAVVEAGANLIGRFDLESRLKLFRANGATFANHELLAMTFSGANGAVRYDFNDVVRREVEASNIPATMSPSELQVKDHLLTMRYGLLARAAVGDLILAPALPSDSLALVSRLAIAAAGADSSTPKTPEAACPVFIERVCQLSGLESTCIPQQACFRALELMAERLDQPFISIDREQDLQLGGSVSPLLVDASVYQLGSGTTPGQWASAKLRLDEQELDLEATWSGQLETE